MEAWGFKYKTNIIWNKVRKDGEPDGRGVGFILEIQQRLFCLVQEELKSEL